jgi:ribokinase
VHSARDAGEPYHPGDLDPPPRWVVSTSGSAGGAYSDASGEHRYAAAELPGPVVDAYGCGDSFAAGLTFALARGDSMEEALQFAARCGAACLTGRGPYAGQLELT